jgi:hypothetical protein
MKNTVLFAFIFLIFSQANCQWQKIESFPKAWIRCFAVSGDKIFAGCIDGVYLSSDRCNHWKKINEGLTCKQVNDIVVNEHMIIAGTDSGVFYSCQEKIHWILINNGLPLIKINTLALQGSILFAGTIEGIFQTDVCTGIWKQSNNQLNVSHIIISGNNVIALDQEIFISDDFGSSWKKAVNSPVDPTTIVAVNDKVFVGGGCRTDLIMDCYNFFKSEDNGQSWPDNNKGKSVGWASISSLAVKGNIIAVEKV